MAGREELDVMSERIYIVTYKAGSVGVGGTPKSVYFVMSNEVWNAFFWM